MEPVLACRKLSFLQNPRNYSRRKIHGPILTHQPGKLLNGKMPENRLFIDSPVRTNEELWLSGDAARYVGRVLRLRPTGKLIIFDGLGGEYSATILAFRKQQVLISIGDKSKRDAESSLTVRLLQCVSRGDRMDFVVQKATELGVQRISPILSEFSVVRLDRDRARKKVSHWMRIAQSACEQCGRNIVPRIDEPVEFRRWLGDNLSSDATRLLLQPLAADSLSAVRKPATGVELLIGPEGGLSDAEISTAASAGFLAVSMGPRVLRTETAALTAISIIQSRFGDL